MVVVHSRTIVTINLLSLLVLLVLVLFISIFFSLFVFPVTFHTLVVQTITIASHQRLSYKPAS